MEPVLSIRGVSKMFPGVKALNNIDLTIESGEIHGIVGENGAGKSTLMKILSGVYKKDTGIIFMSGTEVDIKSPVHSQTLGISIIYQEFNLVDTLSAAENIFLGRTGEAGGRKRMNDRAGALLESIECGVDPRRRIADLSMSEKQMVEIAKALSFDSKIIIMDEPTTTLTGKETEKLFAIIRRLREKGVTILYISHKLDEIMELCDRVSVMRDGQLLGTMAATNLDRGEMIAMMVGRAMDMEYPRRESTAGDLLMQVDHLSTGKLQDISFGLRKGEILGLVGLVGSGRTELARAIFGADPVHTGTIAINGKGVRIRSPIHAIKAGVALVTENRKEQGLVLDFSVARNITMASLKKFSSAFVMQSGPEKKDVADYIDKLAIKTPSPLSKILNLSGGNQQKCVIARWLETEPLILILDEPTRGVDVGAKYEIYLIMKDIVERGGSILMISSELPEVLSMSDRVLVMRDGRISGEFDPRQTSREEIMANAIG